jgi:hypothetical protein
MTGGSWPALLLHDIPRTASIGTVTAHALLHTYLGGPTAWPGRTQALDSDQQDRLRRRPQSVDDALLGVATRTLLWLSVAPAELEATARAIAGHGEPAFVAAITGTHNLVAQVLTSSPAELHSYLTDPLADLDAIRAIETTPVLRTLKEL